MNKICQAELLTIEFDPFGSVYKKTPQMNCQCLCMLFAQTKKATGLQSHAPIVANCPEMAGTVPDFCALSGGVPVEAKCQQRPGIYAHLYSASTRLDGHCSHNRV